MAQMTSKQRIMATTSGKEPDRVPVGGMVNDFLYLHLYGPDAMLTFARDEKKYADMMVFACKELGLDSCGNVPDTNWLWEAVAEASGLNYPASYWKGFGAQGPDRLYSGDPLKDIVHGDPLIKTAKDALKLKPADPYQHGRLPVMVKAIELAKKELKDDWGVGGTAGHPSWDMAILTGWPQMFMAMKKDPPFWNAIMEVGIETCTRFVLAQAKAGAGSFSSVSLLPMWVGSDELLQNPVWLHAEHPPEFYNRMFNEFKIKIGVHPCTVGPFLPGIKVWKTWLEHCPSFAMPECGGADALAIAKKELAPATMIGNFHPLDVLCHGTPQDVENACQELIQKCAPGGRFILSPGCGVPVATPYENLKAWVNSAEKFGHYPIEADKL